MKIFHNANIRAPGYPQVTAMAIDHGNFIALGSDVDILDSSFHASQITNLEGRTIWPGLTDAHVHLRHLADSMAMINCETGSLDECLALVKATANQLPPEAWVRGHGWNQNRWAAGFGNANMLDAVCGDRPAYLTAKSLHASWANSKALAIAGIDSHTPNPPKGIIQRDETGQPTGILFETGAMALVESVIPKPSQSDLIAKIIALIPELWKLGLVGVHDFDGIDCWKALLACYHNDNLKIRVCKNIPFDHLDSFIQAGLRTDDGDNWLHLGGVKLFSDGALGPQTAAMLQPYDRSEEVGTLLLSDEEIFDIGKRAVSHGIALTVHAIGDRANRVVLNAFERLRIYEQAHSLPHFNHRIEHVQIIDPEDLPRLAWLDLTASVQPVHAPSDMDMADRYLGSRSENAYAYRSILESGARIVFGSDAPVEPVNPFQGLHAAVTRRKLNGAPGLEGWQPDQRLSLAQSLDGFSRTPAEIINRSESLGRIAPGCKADFLILEEDPFIKEPHELGRITPLATFIDGECVFQTTSISLEPNRTCDTTKSFPE